MSSENNEINAVNTTEKQNKSSGITLFVLALAVAIVVIDGTVLNVSIRDITSDLKISLQDIQWAITLYSLIIASLTIFGSRLGDIFGRKITFVVGAIIFGLGSLITALSQDLNGLIFGWSVVEGIGAALMIPASSALLVNNFEGKARGRAFAMYGATAGVASAIGPILGGYLTTNFSWRWAFGINLFVVLILVAGSLYIKGYKVIGDSLKKLDFVGVILSGIGLASVTYGFIESSTYGWLEAKKPWEAFGRSMDLAGISITVYTILIGLVLLVAFYLWEKRVKRTEGMEPLIDVDIFKNRQFSSAISMIAILFSGFTGIITFGVVLYYQNVLNLSAFDSGVGLLALSLGTFIAAPLSARVSERFSVGRTVQTGLLISILGCYLIYLFLVEGATRLSLSPALFIFGFGFGLLVSQLTNLVLSAVSQDQAGQASGLNGTIREVGRSFGAAIIGAIFISAFASNFSDVLKNKPQIPGPLKETMSKVLDDSGNQYALNSFANNPQLPANTKSQIQESLNYANINAGRNSVLVTLSFAIITFLLSFTLPKHVFTVHKDEKKAELSEVI